jgi:predicted dehydrogenase
LKLEKIGVGIIGCGGIAVAKHIPSLLKDPRVEIRGIYEEFDQKRALSAIEEFGLKVCTLYGSLEQMLAEDAIAVVHVCTPNNTHAKLSIQALKAGKHVMCEKPMATSTSDAIAMNEASRRSGKKLTICSNNRFREDSWTLKKFCEHDTLGTIYYAKATYLRRRGVPTWGSFMDKDFQGGGPVIDIGTHALDLALWMMNNYKPKCVFASTYNHLGRQTSEANPYGNWKSEDFTTEDFGVGLIKMEDGASVLLEASWLLNIREDKNAKVTLCGTKAGADMDRGLSVFGEQCGKLFDQDFLLNNQGISFYAPKTLYGPELEIKCWIDIIINDTKPVVEPYQMIAFMRIIEALYQSAETGKAVYIED